MEQPDLKGFKPPTSMQQSEPGMLLHWIREQFNSQVALGVEPQHAVSVLQNFLRTLKVPPRVIVRCRVSEDQDISVAFEWPKFEARRDEAQARWFLYMPATPLEPVPTQPLVEDKS